MAKLLLPPDARKPLIMMCGNYGTGKAKAAELLQKHLEGFKLFTFDEVQRELEQSGRYAESGKQVYFRMDGLAREALRQNLGVILDRAHPTYNARHMTYGLAREFGSQALLVECACPDDVAEHRISKEAHDLHQHHHVERLLTREQIKKSWQDAARDFERDPSLAGFVTHILYDTDEIQASIQRAAEPLLSFAEGVCSLLNGFHP